MRPTGAISYLWIIVSVSMHYLNPTERVGLIACEHHHLMEI